MMATHYYHVLSKFLTEVIFWQVVSVPPGGEHSKFVLQLTNIHALSEVASLGSNSCHQFAVCMVKLGGDYLVTDLLSFHYHPTAYMSIPSSVHAPGYSWTLVIDMGY